MTDAELTTAHIDEPLVRRLIEEQFPQWRELPIEKVSPGGWDNRTFRLGEELAVRLPSSESYASQPVRESRWLPALGHRLPLSIPQPLALGGAGAGYPWRWTVNRWLPGTVFTDVEFSLWQLERLAEDLGEFLVAMHGVDPVDGPHPGPENFHRGGSLEHYDRQTREAIEILVVRGLLADGDAAVALWQSALEADTHQDPVWVHGDVAGDNLLVDAVTGWLTAVIDWGCLAVGDPACDLVAAWTLFEGESRAAFEGALAESPAVDDGTWRRAAGWALWKAAITLAESAADPGATRTLEGLGVEIHRAEATDSA